MRGRLGILRIEQLRQDVDLFVDRPAGDALPGGVDLASTPALEDPMELVAAIQPEPQPPIANEAEPAANLDPDRITVSY